MSGYCSNCGTPIEYENAERCPKCGFSLQSPKKKSTFLAALCSFIIPGLGQVYNGSLKRGGALLLGFWIGITLFIPGLIVWVYGIYDAHKTAKQINSGEIPFKDASILKMIVFIALTLLIYLFFASIIAAYTLATAGP